MPAVFDKPEQTHGIYAAFREWAGITPEFRTYQPAVEASSLAGDHRGYLVLVNHSDSLQHVSVASKLALRSMTRISADGGHALSASSSKWKIDLAPYEGVVVEWKQ